MYRKALSTLFCLAVFPLISTSRAATFTVTTTADSGVGSLRQAITDANASAGPDVIDFNIAPAGEKTITLPSAAGTQMLPAITDPVTIDGATQPGFTSKPIIELNGANTGLITNDGLRITTSNCVVRGLVINRFRSDGIEISGGSSNVVEGCIIGLNMAGTAGSANSGNGVNITNSMGNRIGGATAGARNVISGNSQAGVLIDGTESTRNRVEGNYIGTDLNGAVDLGNNTDGVRINNAPATRVGDVGSGNVISGNNSDGIEITGATALDSILRGNKIGLNAAGAAGLGNSVHGVHISGNSSGNIIGTHAPGAANTIAFNTQDGIYIASGTNNTIRANSTYSNNGMGIDLDPNGVTANDAGDLDTGANHRQNFPLLTAATASSGDTFISGTLNSIPGVIYTIDVYGVSVPDAGGGEGQHYLGSVMTDNSGNPSFSGTFTVALTARNITATATDEWGNTSEFSPNVNVATTVAGATFTVTTTADSGVGSLRQAILDANAAAGLNTIAFNIPGDGPHTISNLTALPPITNSVIIDGYTQPGAVANTSAAAWNGTLKIVLTKATTAGSFDGLSLQWPGTTVRGLNIVGFSGDAIEIGAAAHGCVVEGCLLGVDSAGAARPNTLAGVHINNSTVNRVGGTTPGARNVISGNGNAGVAMEGAGSNGNTIVGNNIGVSLDGLARIANGHDGVRINGGSNNTIGGTAAGSRNVLSGNNQDGVEISGAGGAGNVVQGNYIGTDVNGSAAIGNSSFGVAIFSSRNNLIGGLAAGAGSVIAFNGQDGVYVTTGTNNTIRANSIHSNGNLGIDLEPNGINPNDVGDGDPTAVQNAANLRQNFPVITSATAHAASTDISGTLNSGTNVTYILDFYANVIADVGISGASNHGEGQQYLGSTTVTTDGDGNATFSLSLPVGAIGKFICGTATDPFGNTSEFGLCFGASSDVPGQTFTVTTAADAGPGSLRQAILDANALFTAGDTIVFNIPGDGPHTITLASALPFITDAVTIEGYSQPGAVQNTSAAAFNGVLKIILNGASVATIIDGLAVQWPGVTIRGLNIIGFRNDGIEISAANCRVEGCVIGLGLNGSDQGNSQDGILILNTDNAQIGGLNPEARNIISGNTRHGVDISGANAAGNRILGNIIGLGLDGTTRVGNSGDGVSINTSAHNNTIGGAAPGARNVLSGNANDGVEINGIGANGNVVAGNYIGTDVNGTVAAANNANGVQITGNTPANNRIGGGDVNQGNRIAFNNGDGVNLAGGTNNTVRGNSIVSNGDLGIDMGPGGVTANDVGDADTGANFLQNSPVMTSAMANAANTVVRGTLNSRPDTSYTVDFYSSLRPEGNNNFEGDKYLGSTSVTTDASGNATFDVTVNGVVNGRFITATATDPNGNTSEFSAGVRADSTIPPATLVVTTTADSGAGSLRQALLDAGNYVSGSPININFQIPGSGVQVIAPLTELPGPTEAVSLNGYSQTGASANTLAVGNNAVIRVHLSGANISFRSGLKFSVAGNVIRGLAITGFGNNGLELSGDGNRVEGCFIGLAPNGTATANSPAGIRLVRANNNGGRNNIIGGGAPAARNVISGNVSYGVWMENGSDNTVQGNYIGTNPAGTAAEGNGSAGVYINNAQRNLVGGSGAGEGNLISGNVNGNGVSMQDNGVAANRILGNIIGADATGARRLANNVGVQSSNGSGNVIGGANAGEGNTIAFNNSHGVHIYGFSARTGNVVRGNSIHNNERMGIELDFDNVTENDAGDADDGSNLLQNFPVLTAASATLADVTISGALNSAANATFTVDFYASVLADGTGNGEGQQYLGSTTVPTGADGNGAFNVTLPKVITGRFITATATDAGGNTSEFSDAFEATTIFPNETFVVTNTNDDGAGSLREAILANNSSIAGGNNTISFAIPGDGPHRIVPTASSLPVIIHPVTIDGFTQAGASANTLAIGNNSVLKIAIVGDAQQFTAGLQVRADGSVIRGLSMKGFGPQILISADDVRVSGCWLGLLPDATATGTQSIGITVNNDADGALIGGTAPADRNVIAAHTSYGIYSMPLSSGARIQGNYIGTLPSGVQARGNGSYGIFLGGGGHAVGGAAAGAGNLIVGGFHGMGVYESRNCTVQGNLIGTDANGLVRLGGSGAGIEFSSPVIGMLIGGSAPGERNVISGNGSYGISSIYQGVENNRIVGNFIGTDITGAAPLGNGLDGVYLATSGTEVGGDTEAEGNIIAHNGARGVAISGLVTGNLVRANRIFANRNLGIDLNNDGPNQNDSTDADTGANNLQNYPIISAATVGVGDVQIQGALQSSANQSFEVDFFANVAQDPSGFGQGAQYLGSATVNTGSDGRGDFSVTFAKVAVGRFITATATDSQNNSSEFSPSFRATSTRPPQTFVVTTTANAGAGSLRQALLDAANFFSGSPHKIQFNIAGAGPHMIEIVEPLPEPGEPVEIDGFTQPGTSVNTEAERDNAIRLIHLRRATTGNAFVGLRFENAGNIVRGLVISDFPGNAIEFERADNCVVEGCLISGNSSYGINVNNSVGVLIGGSQLKARNVIYDNNSGGITVAGPSFGENRAADNRVLGNFIGTNADGNSPPGGSQFYGVHVNLANRTQIGAAAAGEGNWIAFNNRGVGIQNGEGNRIHGNRIFSNGNLGIDLGVNGPTSNDAGDVDTGANASQNYPVLELANVTTGGTRVTGNLNSAPNAAFVIGFYWNGSCDNTTFGEGASYIGETTVNTDASGNASFNVVLPSPVARGVVTATATDSAGNTSEFSTCATVGTELPPQAFTVTNTSDSGAGSLRQAILDANDVFTTGASTISFNIPGSVVQVISPVSPLPNITSAVTIDGFTQPGSRRNATAGQFDAILRIRLDGALAGDAADGLRILANDTVIEGLIVTGFKGAGIRTINANNVRISENYIGDIPGTAAPAGGKKSNVAAVPVAPANNIGLAFEGGGGLQLVPRDGNGFGNRIANNILAGFDATLTRGVFVAAGDIDGNGSSDLIIGQGGGIVSRGTIDLTIQNSTFENNMPNGFTSIRDGNAAGSGLTIRDSVFAGNSPGEGPSGGGIFISQTPFNTIADSTFEGLGGDAITIDGPNTSGNNLIVNNTIRGNDGAAILVQRGSGVNIGGSTVGERNVIEKNGAGVLMLGAGGRAHNNRIAANNLVEQTQSSPDSRLLPGESRVEGPNKIFTFQGAGHSPNQTFTLLIVIPVITPIGAWVEPFESRTVMTDAEGRFKLELTFDNADAPPFMGAVIPSTFGNAELTFAEPPPGQGNSIVNLNGPNLIAPGANVTFQVTLDNTRRSGNPFGHMQSIVQISPNLRFTGATVQDNGNQVAVTDVGNELFLQSFFVNDSPVNVNLNLIANNSPGQFFVDVLGDVNLGDDSNPDDNNPFLQGLIDNPVSGFDPRFGQNFVLNNNIFEDQRAIIDLSLFNGGNVGGPFTLTFSSPSGDVFDVLPAPDSMNEFGLVFDPATGQLTYPGPFTGSANIVTALTFPQPGTFVVNANIQAQNDVNPNNNSAMFTFTVRPAPTSGETDTVGLGAPFGDITHFIVPGLHIGDMNGDPGNNGIVHGPFYAGLPGAFQITVSENGYLDLSANLNQNSTFDFFNPNGPSELISPELRRLPNQENPLAYGGVGTLFVQKGPNDYLWTPPAGQDYSKPVAVQASFSSFGMYNANGTAVNGEAVGFFINVTDADTGIRDVQVLTPGLYTGQEGIFTFDVVNFGSTPANEVRLVVDPLDARVYVAGSGGTVWVQDPGETSFRLLEPLAAGASVQTTVGVSFNEPGTFPVSFHVEQAQPQANIANNGGSTTFTVGTLPPAAPDMGDALESYRTTKAVGGPKHGIVGGAPILGTAIDADADGVPTLLADGDDTDADGDDEDGVVFIDGIVAGAQVRIDITASSPGFLDAWIDYNNDGVFSLNRKMDEPHEYICGDFLGAPALINGHADSFPLKAGLNELVLRVPNSGYVAANTYARFRISTLKWMLPFGDIPDGEVEDYLVQIFDAHPDFGDAPDDHATPGYPTLLVHNGAYHIADEATFHLGQRIDYETDGKPSLLALGDDEHNGLEFPQSDNPDDEDGVTLPSGLLQGQLISANVVLTMATPGPAKLDGWIDFNQDKDWSDAGEKILTSADLIDGNNVLSFVVPATATLGKTYARFRLSRNGNLQPFGKVIGGEVEDYQVEITAQTGPPTLTYRVTTTGQLVLTFGPNARLVRAPSVLGPWQDAGDQSPFTVDTSVGQMFFRAVSP